MLASFVLVSWSLSLLEFVPFIFVHAFFVVLVALRVVWFLLFHVALRFDFVTMTLSQIDHHEINESSYIPVVTHEAEMIRKHTELSWLPKIRKF